jgi:hypothetical protein
MLNKRTGAWQIDFKDLTKYFESQARTNVNNKKKYLRLVLFSSLLSSSLLMTILLVPVALLYQIIFWTSSPPTSC